MLFSANPSQSPTGVTVACWINVSSVLDLYGRIIATLGDKNSSFCSLQIYQGDKIYSLIGFQAGYCESVYTPQTWIHAVMTFNGNESKLYLNGVLISNNAGSGDISAYFSELNIGYNIAANRYLQGSIDELYIYNRALSPAEVTQLYNLK